MFHALWTIHFDVWFWYDVGSKLVSSSFFIFGELCAHNLKIDNFSKQICLPQLICFRIIYSRLTFRRLFLKELTKTKPIVLPVPFTTALTGISTLSIFTPVRFLLDPTGIDTGSRRLYQLAIISIANFHWLFARIVRTNLVEFFDYCTTPVGFPTSATGVQ